EQIFETMNREIKRIKTGEVTMAVKDSSINGLQIREGEFIGLVDDEILVKGDNTSEIVILLLNQLADEGDLISIYYGEEVKEEEANLLKKEVEAQFPNYDVELTRGGQPFYPYLISVE
ncbi:MAG: DAK2 domain-containing protein, partial [Syntrophomonadaceae bacterium]|nr:DAK2 domain-containing protein [Syntrophomonadaceae bacterium]